MSKGACRAGVPAAYVAIGAGGGRALAVAGTRDDDIAEHRGRRLQHKPRVVQIAETPFNRSTRPSLPKPGAGFPVVTSSASR